MVNSAHIPSSRRGTQRRHTPSIQVLQSLMVLIGKGKHKLPSSHTNINTMIIWSVMVCGVYSTQHNLSINKRSGTFFYVSLNLPWTKLNTMSRDFRKVLRWISICFGTLCGNECTWGALFFFSFSEGTDIGTTDSNRTWGLYHHYDYIYLWFLWWFGRDSYPYEYSQTK